MPGPTRVGVIEPSESQIAPGAELTITFPNEMVSKDKIDLSEQPSPFVSKPKIEGNFLWKSQTEGVFVVKSAVTGAKHRLALGPGLKDASGKPVVAPGGAQSSPRRRLRFRAIFLSAKSSMHFQIPLESSYSVRLTEVAEHLYFQDRDSRQRFPVDVILQTEEKLTEQPEAEIFASSRASRCRWATPTI